jgi:DNA-binding NarL/FixJ family response regulator
VIRVLIVHDSSILSAGLRMMLSSAADIEVVGEANDDTAASMAAVLDPQIVVVDADLCRSSVATVRALSARCPHIRIVVLGLHDDPETRAEALHAGACSFVSKLVPEQMLAEIRGGERD